EPAPNSAPFPAALQQTSPSGPKGFWTRSPPHCNPRQRPFFLTCGTPVPQTAIPALRDWEPQFPAPFHRAPPAHPVRSSPIFWKSTPAPQTSPHSPAVFPSTHGYFRSASPPIRTAGPVSSPFFRQCPEYPVYYPPHRPTSLKYQSPAIRLLSPTFLKFPPPPVPPRHCPYGPVYR